jgi:hypothetical protein
MKICNMRSYYMYKYERKLHDKINMEFPYSSHYEYPFISLIIINAVEVINEINK